ncbi:MAG: beta strand repeat-containing protein [Pyrinomonadaceae bacterium]
MRSKHWIRVWACFAFFILILNCQEAKAQAISVDNTSSAGVAGANVTTLTWSHTVGTGSNRILIVGVSIFGGGLTVSSVTYGGTALTRIGGQTDSGNKVRMEIWKLVAPASGTASIVVTPSAATRVVGGAVSFNNVDQTIPNGTFASASGSSTAPSVNVTSATGEVVIDTLVATGDAISASVGAGQTQRWNKTTGSTSTEVLGAGSTEPGASTVTMSWTLGFSKKWAIGGVSLKPAAQLPDLTITKSHSGNFTQGQVGATYTITATNSGFAATSGTVTVTDTLPAGLTATAISGTGWTCVLGTLTCTRSDALAAGASYPAITLTVTVANNAAASVTNSASVSGGGQTNTANDTANDVTTINQLPDLTITKSHSGNFTQGQVGATYTITATNSGFAATSGTITVTDTLPAGLTATAISGSGWTCVLGTLTCTRSDALAVGASYPAITLTVTVANNAATSVTNSASVSGGGETNTANDSANDVTTINQLPDLTITKSHSGNFTQGQVGATYTITATNSGFAATSGVVTVTDTLPAGLTATAISGTGWTCVLGTLTCTRSDALAVGASYPAITLTLTVANNAAASVTNSASVSGGGETNTANDTANDVTTINQLPDLTITKTHSGNFTQGQVGATYSITATNSGFAATSGTVTVTDTLPAGLTATAISGSGWTCVLGTLTCTRSDALAAGLSYSAITLTVTVANNAAASVTNSASVSGGGETNTANDTANDLTTINPAAPPSISLVKSVSPNGSQIPGTDLLYTVVYSNTGGQPANNFIIDDPNMGNIVPAERVFRDVDLKVGSLTSSPGSTGLVATFQYSNDGGTTWTYTPVSGAGGAPAGYDRVVTNIRWSFAGSLSQTAPNNTGSVGLTVRIR